MHRDGTTWVIAGVSDAGDSRARRRLACAATEATQVAAQRNCRSPHARRRAVRHEHNTTGHYSREARTGYA